MEEFIKKGWAEKHFPRIKKLPEIVADALDKPRVQKERSLQTLCIQKLLEMTMEKESVEEIYYKLLFLEPLDVVSTLNFLHQKLVCPSSRPAPPTPVQAFDIDRFESLLPSLASLVHDDFSTPYDISINDPLLLQYLLDQNLRRSTFDEFRVHVQDHMVSVYSESKMLLKAPTEEMFANDWAVIFGKIALEKQVDQIDLNFDECSNRPSAEKKYWLSGIAKQFPMIGASDPRYAPAVRSYRKEEYIFCKMHSLQFYNKDACMYAQDLIVISDEDERTMTCIYYPDN